MPISGNNEPRKLLSSMLDKDSLLLLCRDLLFVRGHKDIRITNGPGDGQRDLHSVFEYEPHVAQCKFHADPDKACTSLEVGELPLALVKFGSKKGLFFTNARLSPQAKKEMLNDYPGLTLEFIDGDTLALEVMEHPLLKQAWFNGKEIIELPRVISFPVLVRIQDNDLPFNLFLNEAKVQAFRKQMKKSYPEYAVDVSFGTRTVEDFRPYRPPSFPTMEEGFSPWIRSVEIILQGEVDIAEVEQISCVIAENVARLAYENARITVIVGTPKLCSVTEPTEGAPISVTSNHANYITTESVCTRERDFFSADFAPDYWTTENDARVSEADWIRLYAPKIDCALAYEMKYTSMTGPDSNIIVSFAARQFGWDYSLHTLLPKWEGDWPYADIPEPDEITHWYGEKVICNWFHALISGEGTIPMPSWINPIQPLSLPNSKERSAELREIEYKLEGIPGVEILDSDKATHMMAVMGKDAFDAERKWSYQTGELLHHLRNTRSPLFARRREFMATFVWEVQEPNEVNVESQQEFELLALFPETSYNGNFLVVELDVLPMRINDDSTSNIIIFAHDCLMRWAEAFEVKLSSSSFGTVRRCTAEYWKKNYNVALGVSHEKSNKKYFGSTPSEVGLEFLIERSRKNSRIKNSDAG